MTPVKMDEKFAAALRDLLVEQAEEVGARPSWWSGRSRRWVVGAGSVLLLASGGTGIAAATGVFTQPGADVDTALVAPVSTTGTGTETVQLGAQPAGTNAITISFTCLTTGTFSLADGSVTCDGRRPDRPHFFTSTGTVTIAPGTDSTTVVTASPGARWRLTVTYVSVTHITWAVNANGQTYGVMNSHGEPDLLSTIATNGKTGYVYTRQLNGPMPKTPAQAIAMQKAEAKAGPRVLTVYKSDGKTPIGKFSIPAAPRMLQLPTGNLQSAHGQATETVPATPAPTQPAPAKTTTSGS